MGKELINKYPFVQGMNPTTTNTLNAYLNQVIIFNTKKILKIYKKKTWKAQLSVTGADHLP